LIKGACSRLQSPLDYSNTKEENKNYNKAEGVNNFKYKNKTMNNPSSYPHTTMNHHQNIQTHLNKNFMKLGTTIERKTKFSIVNNLRRNTNLNTSDTQQVIENICPIVNKPAFERNLRQTAMSPNPNINRKIRAFSPTLISEFDEINESEREGSKETAKRNKILNQFKKQRNAVSPFL